MSHLVSLFCISSYLLPFMQGQDVRCLPTEVIVREGNDLEWHHTCNRLCPANLYLYRKQCYNTCPSHTVARYNGFIKYCVSDMDLEQFHCPKFICQKEYPYCFDGNCLDSCPEYTIGYTNSCVMTCPSEAKYITAVSCEGVCYSGYKFCSSECPVSHPFQFRLNHYYHCLKECPSFTMQNSTKCELSCPDDRPLLFNKTCRSTCPLSSPFTSLKTSVFNKIYVCSERCDDMMASYRNVCVSVCPSKSPMEYHGKCVETCLKDRPFINTTPAKKASIYYQQCVAKCPPDKFLWLKNKKCVTDCPAKSPLEYRGKCVEACQKDRPFINTEEMTSKYHQQCVSKCPPDKLAWIKNKRCVNNCLTNTLLFNKTCVEVCPQTFPLNYTKVEHGKREHICVKKCPGNAYQYKYFCFDQCPSYLKYFLSNCTLECPKTYPYIHIDNVTCVQSCPDHYVYNGKRCAEKCPREHFYIENKQCVNVCSNISALQRQTNQGIVCLNSFFCPIDTVLMENTTQCYGRCPESLLIINNICTHGISCPNNTYKENFSLGTMCTKKCSEKLYMDVNRCVKNCPSSKVIVGHRCSNDCPKSKPYRLIDTKHFVSLLKFQTFCVSVCPNDYVIYQKKCISGKGCSQMDRYVYDGRCYDVCPKLTSPNIGNTWYMCVDQQSNFYGGITLICFGISGFLAFICIFCCYKGRLKHQRYSSQEDEDESRTFIEDIEIRPG